jgi:hypothetical protein
MSKILLILLILITASCSKPKTVLICGDHVCVNKDEARQYFEENLTLEVKVINKKELNNIDLVELNLNSNIKEGKKITLKNKKNTKNVLKELSNDDVKKKKKIIKEKKIKKRQEIIKQNNSIKKKEAKLKVSLSKNENKLSKKKLKYKVNNNLLTSKKNDDIHSEKIIDICTILPKCNIEEISEYLIKLSQEKRYPNITNRE